MQSRFQPPQSCAASARSRPVREGRRGFSQVELLVVTAIIALLVAIALPAMGRAREAARRAQCRNNLRNIGLAVIGFEQAQRRLPPSGYHYDVDGVEALHHSWAVSILPWLDQSALYERWDLGRPVTDPANESLTRTHLPIYVCPADISRSRDPKEGDLSYAVSGGVGFTVRLDGVPDCPVDRNWTPLDLNGDGVACPQEPEEDAQPADRLLFKRMGLFFMENWNEGGTVRHHALADVRDGLSQTFCTAENVRVGYDPRDRTGTFASPNPYRCAFYIGNPCLEASCREGTIDYSLSNSGKDRINGGLRTPEGRSPVPNSFHPGGVNMCYADGRVSFLSELIDGKVYAALASPQGMLLDETPLAQVIVSDF